jgi:anti-anti-sigma factor
MKTLIKKNGDTVVVNLDGRLDFETNIPFREDLEKLIDDSNMSSAPTKFIFNMENLEFVGSSGISSFVQTLKDFSEVTPTKPRYCNVRSEFRQIFKAFDENEVFEFFESEDRAKKSFDQ